METQQKKDRQPLLLVVDDIAKNIQLIGNVLQKENYLLPIMANRQ
jgi:CheY-like chemotaxis protein